MSSALRRRLQAHSASEDGFTIIELMVAIMVIAIGLLGLMAVQVRSIGSVALSGQRQAAVGLANQAMEQMRSLPYGTLTGGLVCTDLASDAANITVISAGTNCVADFRPTYDVSVNEALVTTSGTQVAPLNPHIQPLTTTKIKNVQYKVRSYVSRVSRTADVGYWLTVITTWSSNVTRGETKSFAARSQVYSPSGCLATTTHPFSGPCQAFHYSDAGSSGGGISLSSTRAGLAVVDGLVTTTTSASLLSFAARTQSEQVLSAQSKVTTSAFKLQGGAGDSGGGFSAVSSADTDPSTGTANSPASSSTVSQSGSTSRTDSGGGTQLTVSADPTGTGSTYSTMTASTTPACSDDANIGITNGQACSSSLATPGAPVATTLRLPAMSVGSMVIGSIAAGATPWNAFGGQFRNGTTDHCTGTSGAGCVAAGMRRSLGTITAGGFAVVTGTDRLRNHLGADVTTAFANGATSLATITGYTDRAYSESGPSAKPSVFSRTGSVSVWNGTGFDVVPLASVGTATRSIPAVTATYGTTTVTVTGQLVTTAPAATVTGTSPCVSNSCSVKASAGSARVQLTYTIATGGVVVGAFTATVDLGTTLAQTTYKGAPSA